MSKRALIKLTAIVKRDKKLFSADGVFEDGRMGKALAHSAIFVDCRDVMQRERFFPITVKSLIKGLAPNHWFNRYNYYNFSLNGITGFSDVAISFHYIQPTGMFLLEYLIYQVHAFGVQKNQSEILPQKLKLEEIIAASDANSSAPNFRKHTDLHRLTVSELF